MPMTPSKRQKLVKALTTIIGIVEKCGGPGSGIPGPCPGQRSGSGKNQKISDDIFSSEKLFKKHEVEPKVLHQPSKTKEGVYELATKALPGFRFGLNTGKGVDKAIGGKTVAPTNAEEFTKAVEAKGNMVLLAPIKGEKRAVEKTTMKYGGDYSRLHDVVRATVALSSKKDIPLAISALRTHMGKNGYELVDADNRMANPLPSGYRDISTKWKSKEGFIVEIQVNTKAMIRAKEGQGHKLYEEYRIINEAVKKSGGPASPEQLNKMQALDKSMSDIYEKAWQT